jgi:hypothetical protein
MTSIEAPGIIISAVGVLLPIVLAFLSIQYIPKVMRKQDNEGETHG